MPAPNVSAEAHTHAAGEALDSPVKPPAPATGCRHRSRGATRPRAASRARPPCGASKSGAHAATGSAQTAWHAALRSPHHLEHGARRTRCSRQRLEALLPRGPDAAALRRRAEFRSGERAGAAMRLLPTGRVAAAAPRGDRNHCRADSPSRDCGASRGVHLVQLGNCLLRPTPSRPRHRLLATPTPLRSSGTLTVDRKLRRCPCLQPCSPTSRTPPAHACPLRESVFLGCLRVHAAGQLPAPLVLPTSICACCSLMSQLTARCSTELPSAWPTRTFRSKSSQLCGWGAWWRCVSPMAASGHWL